MTFKDTLRGFLSSVLPPSVMGVLGTGVGSKSVPHLDVQMPIVVWVHLVMTCLQGWTSESIAMWIELTSYRLDKAFHCKVPNSRNEHEFVIYEFSDDKKHKLQLRSDRSAGERKDTVTMSSSSVESFGTDLEESSPLVDFSPQSSSSSLSMKGRFSKIPGSIRHAVRRLSDSSISRPSAISSNQYLAADTITRISGHPPNSNVLRTITFNDNRAKRPSLWDVMILASVVHSDSATYTILGRQCYWFADTIFGLLEMWAKIYGNEATTTDEKERPKRGRRRASTGNLGVVPVHRRDPVHINKIWDGFTGERQTMGKQREEFERARTEEIRKTKELAGQVTMLKLEQVKEKQEREKERRERDEKEQWLRKEQVEREQLMEERERQLKKEQEEREQRHQEEQRLLRQQIADQQRQLEEQHRQWNLRLQQKEEETERRFQQMEQRIVRMSSSQINLHLAPSS